MIAATFLALAQRPAWVWDGDLRPSRPDEEFGARITSIPDLDGDGKRDVLIGAPRGDGDRGFVCAASSTSGRILLRVAGKTRNEHFGSALAVGGDLDGDGRVELVACGIARFDGSMPWTVVRAFDGRGSEKLEVHLEQRERIHGSLYLAGAGDLDGDGCDDLVAGTGPDARLVALRGIDGGVVWRVSDHVVATGSWHDCLPRVRSLRGDLDGDGAFDLVATWTPAAEERALHRVALRSGRSGAAFFVATDDLTASYGAALDVGGEIDGDGVADVLVGAPDETANGPSHVLVRSGRTLEPLRAPYDLDPHGYFEGFGASVAWLRDRDGDGRSEILVGCEEVGDSGDEYYAALFDGRTGAKLAACRTQRQMVRVAPLGSDLDGDGLDEVLLALPGAGIVYVTSIRRDAASASGWMWRNIRGISSEGCEWGIDEFRGR